jgi:hypothetical protein
MVKAFGALVINDEASETICFVWVFEKIITNSLLFQDIHPLKPSQGSFLESTTSVIPTAKVQCFFIVP